MTEGEPKQSYETLVVRLDERLKAMQDSNDKDHVRIIVAIEDLKNHVNDEIKTIEGRVRKLEDADKTLYDRWSTLAKLGTITTAIITVLYVLSVLFRVVI